MHVCEKPKDLAPARFHVRPNALTGEAFEFRKRAPVDSETALDNHGHGPVLLDKPEQYRATVSSIPSAASFGARAPAAASSWTLPRGDRRAPGSVPRGCPLARAHRPSPVAPRSSRRGYAGGTSARPS